jgi:hypothetical protein
MNNPFQKQPQPIDNPSTSAPQPPEPQPPAQAINETPPIRQNPTVPTLGGETAKSSHAPGQGIPAHGTGSQPGTSQIGPIYPPEAVDIEKLNSFIYSAKPLEDVRKLFSKQVVIDKDTTVQVDTITVPGYIGVSDELFVEDPKGNRVPGYADIAAILKAEDLLICTYQGNPQAYGTPIDLSRDNNQFEEISGLVNREVAGSFKGNIDGLLSNSFTGESLGEFSGHIGLSIMPDGGTGVLGTKLKGTYDGTLQGRFDGTLQGQLKSTTQFENFFIQDTVIKNGGLHTGAIVPARKQNYETGEIIDAFASFNQPAGYHSGVYGGDSLVSVAQRLVFDEVITPEEARGYKQTIINWMGLLSHVAKFADRNIDGGDPTTVVDVATLKTILQNGVRASLGDPDALTFFDDSNNKIYCAEFIYIALNTPLFPFNQSGLTELLDGDSAAAKAVLGHQTRYANAQFNIFSLVRESGAENPELVARNIILPTVPETLLPINRVLTQRGRVAEGLAFPPFTIAQVIRRAFRTLLPQQGTLAASQLAKLQVRLFKAIEPMLTQQVLPTVDFSSLTEETSAAVQADPRVQQIKAFIAQVEDTLTATTDIAELDKRFDEIVEQANTLVRQAGSIVEFVPPRIYVDLGQQDGDDNLPKGWGFQLQTIGATIARQSINGAVPPAISPTVPPALPTEGIPTNAIDGNGGDALG